MNRRRAWKPPIEPSDPGREEYIRRPPSGYTLSLIDGKLYPE